MGGTWPTSVVGSISARRLQLCSNKNFLKSSVGSVALWHLLLPTAHKWIVKGQSHFFFVYVRLVNGDDKWLTNVTNWGSPGGWLLAEFLGAHSLYWSQQPLATVWTRVNVHWTRVNVHWTRVNFSVGVRYWSAWFVLIQCHSPDNSLCKVQAQFVMS